MTEFHVHGNGVLKLEMFKNFSSIRSKAEGLFYARFAFVTPTLLTTTS